MKKINKDNLKQIQIEILNFIDDFCKENDINYWLDCGTLLGAVRHKGYIPWDDDIDIGMLRKDYDKFMKIFNENNKSNYRAYCYENDKNWRYPFGKVLDENTILYEPDEETGEKIRVYVDIFVYDNAPTKISTLKKMYKKRDIFYKLNNLQKFKKFTLAEKQKYNYIRYPFWLLFQLLPKNYFLKKSIKNEKKFKNIETGFVGNFSDMVSHIKCNKSIFDSFVELEFENKKYPAPVGYKEWLEAFYGDYMKLPPIEKRVCHHKYVAYYKDNNKVNKKNKNHTEKNLK